MISVLPCRNGLTRQLIGTSYLGLAVLPCTKRNVQRKTQRGLASVKLGLAYSMSVMMFRLWNEKLERNPPFFLTFLTQKWQSINTIKLHLTMSTSRYNAGALFIHLRYQQGVSADERHWALYLHQSDEQDEHTLGECRLQSSMLTG